MFFVLQSCLVSLRSRAISLFLIGIGRLFSATNALCTRRTVACVCEPDRSGDVAAITRMLALQSLAETRDLEL
jgi:hypothetical protein